MEEINTGISFFPKILSEISLCSVFQF